MARREQRLKRPEATPLKILVAVGGNSIEKPGQTGSVREQVESLALSMGAAADLVVQGHRVVLTHGNGPQVGRALLRTELTGAKLAVDPLFICGAETQGRIGFLMAQALTSALLARNLSVPVTALVTRVLVDPEDADFKNPTKPIGSFYSAQRAQDLMQRRRYQMVEDAGRGWRRVVPSPRPIQILELETIRSLVDAGHVVICCGGGGVPVVPGGAFGFIGVDAVIDKDRASALLAVELAVDVLIITTGVSRVALDFGKPEQREVAVMDVDAARESLAEGQFPPGSMGPKIEGAIDFIEATGSEVIITDPESLLSSLEGRTGTRLTPVAKRS